MTAWTLSNSLWDEISMGPVAINPSVESDLYVQQLSGDDAGVFYKSADYGVTWNATSDPGAVFYHSISVRSGVLYALSQASGTSIYRSLDEGNSWIQYGTGITAGDVLWSLTIDPSSPSTFYACGYSSGKVYRSADSGATWAAGTGLLGYHAMQVAVNPFNPAILYVALYATRVYKSTNSGSTWAVSGTTGMPAFPLNYSIVIDPTTPTTIYVAGLSGIFKSVNSGASWTSINNGIVDTSILYIAISPADHLTLYAGSILGYIYQSADGGDNWVDTTGLPGSSIDNIAIDTSGRAYTSPANRGLYKSINAQCRSVITLAQVINLCKFYDV